MVSRIGLQPPQSTMVKTIMRRCSGWEIWSNWSFLPFLDTWLQSDCCTCLEAAWMANNLVAIQKIPWPSCYHPSNGTYKRSSIRIATISHALVYTSLRLLQMDLNKVTHIKLHDLFIKPFVHCDGSNKTREQAMSERDSAKTTWAALHCKVIALHTWCGRQRIDGLLNSRGRWRCHSLHWTTVD